MELVYLKWDVRPEPGKDFTYIPTIKMEEKVEFNDGVYYSHEYKKIGKKMISFGVIGDYEIVSVTYPNKEQFFLELSDDVWSMKVEYIWDEVYKNHIEKNTSIGVNQAGEYIFKGVQKNGNVNYARLVIESTVMTLEEHDLMLHDLQTMTEELGRLFGSQKSCVEEVKPGNVLALVNKLSSELMLVEKSPAEKLVSVYDVVSFKDLKKISSKGLIKKSLYPYKNYIVDTIIQPTLDIPEHRMIKQALGEFLSISQRHHKQCIHKVSMLEAQISSIEKNKNNIIRCDREQIKFFESKISHLCREIDKYKEDILKWNEIEKKIKKNLEMEIVKEIEGEVLEETYLFEFDSNYQVIYSLLRELGTELNRKTSTLAFYRQIRKSPKVYEKWIFIKLLHTLMDRYKFSSDRDVMSEMIEYFQNNNNELRGFKVDLIKRVEDKDYGGIRLAYEPSIGEKRPDIGIVLYRSAQQKIHGFFDAKYKPYSRKEQQKDLNKDLRQSAIRYKEIEIGGYKGSFAFLVHPDRNLRSEYNVSNNAHEVGYVFLSPTNEIDFHCLIKMLIHFHADWSECCPDCGEIKNVSIEDKGWKQYYKCEKCKAFWVRNSCWNKKDERHQRGKNMLQHTSNTLYKYIDYNYHKETSTDWDFHCPRCDKSYEDYLKNQSGLR